MKRFIFVTFGCYFSIFLSWATIYNGTCGTNLTWSLNTGDSTLIISGVGENLQMSFAQSSYNCPWKKYKSYIKYVSLPNGLANICGYAFTEHTAIESISIPNSVTSIGGSAFASCTSLRVVSGGENVSSIDYQAFSGCNSLTSILDMQHMESIAANAFHRCESLEVVYLNEGLISIDSYAFSGCISLKTLTIPESAVSIAGKAFNTCTSLDSVIINGGFSNNSTIDNDIFTNCTSLKTIIWNAKDYTIPLYKEESFLSAQEGDYYPPIYKQITSVIVGGNVDSIPQGLFSQMTKLKSVTLLDGVKYIGAEVFSGCTKLTSVNIPTSVVNIGKKGFYGCKSLQSIVLPDSLNVLKEYLFDECTALRSVFFPQALDSIGMDAFRNCQSLQSINLPQSLTVIVSGAFNGCVGLTAVTIPQNVTSFGRKVFAGCSNLTTIVWDARNCTSVDSSEPCFYDIREQISSFTFGEDVELVPNKICYGMSLLDTIILPDGVKTIQTYAFENCTSLKHLQIPSSITFFNGSAVIGCDSLNAISIEDLGAWCNINFDGNPLRYVHNLYLNNELLTDIVIPNSVSVLGHYAFEGCTSMNSITIPYSVTKIGYRAFKDCTGLTMVTIPNSVDTIGSLAFESCSSLDSVCIGTHVSYIGGDVFYDCPALRSATCLAVTPPQIERCNGVIFGWRDVYNPESNNGFYFQQVNMYVPQRSIGLYKSFNKLDCYGQWGGEGWSHLKNYYPISQALEVLVDTVSVTEVTENSATIEWPIVPEADTYEVEVKSWHFVYFIEVTSTGLVFKLGLMYFAPNRDHSRSYMATTTSSGWKYTITDLAEGETYTYTVTAKNGYGSVIDVKSGTFTTASTSVPTDIVDTFANPSAPKDGKVLYDGHLYILRNGQAYDLTGRKL